MEMEKIPQPMQPSHPTTSDPNNQRQFTYA